MWERSASDYVQSPTGRNSLPLPLFTGAQSVKGRRRREEEEEEERGRRDMYYGVAVRDTEKRERKERKRRKKGVKGGGGLKRGQE